jgi:hypothetical protein
VEIGSLRFLKLVLRDSTRRRKVRRWLLLALRALAVLLLALLFARPYLRGEGTAGRDREVIVLIDQSASMAVTQGGRTLFAQAQDAADRVLKALPAQTLIRLAYFDDRGVFPEAEPRIDRGRQPGYAGTDFGLALRWARDLLVVSGRPQRRVVFVTDLQRAGVHRTSCTDFPSDVPVEVIEIGKAPVGNLAVETAETPQTLVRSGEPVEVAAGVVNAGAFPARGVRVRLVLEGPGPRVEQAQTLALGAGTRQVVRFKLPAVRTGMYAGSVEVASDDEFPLDNRRWLAFEARPVDRLLLVDGEPGVTPYGDQTYYLETALRLRLPSGGAPRTPYQPEHLAWGEGVRLPDLRGFRVVVLGNVAGLAEADARQLQQFVRGGGSLLIFTGARVTAARYEPLRQMGLLPARVEGITDPGAFAFDTWDVKHPIFRPLSDPQQGDLRRVVFRQLTRLKPVADARVLAVASSGLPLLVEGRDGRGRVLLFAGPADRAWSSWPQTRLYVPLVHQMMGYLTDRLPETEHVHAELAGPGTSNPPGIVRQGADVVVRNLDPRESDLERVTAQQFRAQFHLAEAEATAKTAAAALPPGSQRPDELWVYVAWILLAVLAVEVFVANRTPG